MFICVKSWFYSDHIQSSFLSPVQNLQGTGLFVRVGPLRVVRVIRQENWSDGTASPESHRAASSNWWWGSDWIDPDPPQQRQEGEELHLGAIWNHQWV